MTYDANGNTRENSEFGPFNLPKVGTRYVTDIKDNRAGRWTTGGRLYCEVIAVTDDRIILHRINKAKLGLDHAAKPINVRIERWQEILLADRFYASL